MAYGFLPVPVTLDLMPMFVEFAASVTMGQYVGIVILEWELGHGRLSCMEEGWLDVFSVIPPLARKFNKRRSMNMVFIQEMVFFLAPDDTLPHYPVPGKRTGFNPVKSAVISVRIATWNARNLL
jgi:hypothetical protein